MSETQAIYMPDGRPAPFVMSAEQAAAFLLIESENPDETLRNYREAGKLRATQLGKRLRYQLPDLIEFLKVQREAVPR